MVNRPRIFHSWLPWHASAYTISTILPSICFIDYRTDPFIDPEFNFLSLLRYSRHTEPARLLAPEARYLAGIVQAVGDDPRDIALPGRGWDAWLLILGFGSRDHVLAQE